MHTFCSGRGDQGHETPLEHLQPHCASEHVADHVPCACSEANLRPSQTIYTDGENSTWHFHLFRMKRATCGLNLDWCEMPQYYRTMLIPSKIMQHDCDNNDIPE